MDIRADHVMAASIKMDSRTRKWLVSRVTDIMSFVEREHDNAKPMANGLAINPHVLQVSTAFTNAKIILNFIMYSFLPPLLLPLQTI